MTTIQLTLATLEEIVKHAKLTRKGNSSLSTTVEIILTGQTDNHLGDDGFIARLKSNYAECTSTSLMSQGATPKKR